MSFSKQVKEELSKQFSAARHCQIAEIAAIVSLCGRIVIDQYDRYFVKIHTESLTVARKYYTLVSEAFLVRPEVSVKWSKGQKNRIVSLAIKEWHVSKKLLQAARLLTPFGEIEENLSVCDNIVIQNACCKRAFIRGAFLASGSISDPEKAYHLEIAVTTEQKAEQLREMIHFFEIDAKIVLRKKHFVVYVKEGAQIVDLLNVMEAHQLLMDMENIRILKEMRNSINRQVNCETANINKTVTAASKQLEDILYIKNNMGFEQLSEGLKEIAILRTEHPEASLTELGTMLNHPIGKSGVNHRLKKICSMAELLKEQKEDIENDNEEN